VLEALVQPPKNMEDEDPIFDGGTLVGKTVGHGLELATILRHRGVALNKVMKGSVKVKGMLLTVAEKLVLDGEPEVARCITTFSDHLMKLWWDGIADPVEEDTIHPNPPRIIGQGVDRDVLDEGVALEGLLHKVTPAGIVGGGVEYDVHQLVDIEDRSRLKMKAGDDGVFVGRRGGRNDLRGRGHGRSGCRYSLSGSSSRLL
jgi:hypothetical protein